jgi:hypothetical protein
VRCCAMQIMVDAQAGTIRAYDLNAAKRMLTHAVNSVVCGDAAAAVGRTRAGAERAASGEQTGALQRNQGRRRRGGANDAPKTHQQAQQRQLPLKQPDTAAAAAAAVAAARAAAAVATAAASRAATSAPSNVEPGAVVLSKEEALARFQARKAALAAKASAAAAGASASDTGSTAGAPIGMGGKRVAVPQACGDLKPRPGGASKGAIAERNRLQPQRKPRPQSNQRSAGAAALAAAIAAAASAGGNKGAATKGAHGRAGRTGQGARVRRVARADGGGLAASVLRGLGK